MTTCFFIGHRDAPLSLQESLDKVVLHLIEQCNVTSFIVGYHGNFDRMATSAVSRAKHLYPEINALRLLAFHPSEQSIQIPASFDGTYYPIELSGTPRRFAIKKANQIVMKNCDYLVAYVCHDGGNSAELIRQASRLSQSGKLTAINLYENPSF